ncbi:FAS1-like dehydratase domain-containing protein [Bradyrhizobium vignae]|uniref:FAS1-like dehydratase domain-containing protein n=1 Tax=Bradyrhizobium vignae TaxID=1549949 RepID=UPI00100BAB89|nr:MaoC family dehydratase N-terminal domain-containing protein [Bradyrhizobium vignae]RXG90920.1 hypothetical protein EAV90_28570 [Bradyrhizobium vignae]
MSGTKDQENSELIQIDMKEFEPWIGVPHGGIQMKVPFVQQDFQRWVTHTDNYNPIHFDESWAAASRFGQIVAPQSFTGIRAAGDDAIFMSKTLMAGFHVSDEFFYYGPRIHVGDQLFIDRVLSSARPTNTRYGPSVFLNFGTTFATQRGMIVKKRSTVMLHPKANGLVLGKGKLETAAPVPPEPEWTDAQIDELREAKLAYIRTFRTHEKRRFGSVKVGDKLPRAVFGPHTGLTFLYSDACCPEDVWGLTHVPDQPPLLPKNSNFGYDIPDLPEMPLNRARFVMNEGRGRHVYDKAAIRGGLPRSFAIGSVMTIWGTDHFANWAGEWGFLRHLTMRFNSSIWSGDVTYIDAEVTELSSGPAGCGTVHVTYHLVNQDGLRQCSGTGKIELPLE